MIGHSSSSPPHPSRSISSRKRHTTKIVLDSWVHHLCSIWCPSTVIVTQSNLLIIVRFHHESHYLLHDVPPSSSSWVLARPQAHLPSIDSLYRTPHVTVALTY
ncbi:hypothetical protein PFISCL1PPCAC_2412 [Pristionchus fissidentatus]|uniref:G protein-coupled receptor n=1 Tax=Pristionchus fissidentatus TaxID=1538716 RepID=A0AAV5UZX9_9BILA|nr:hypothetical protein PFISCL1PPCAC_2412 [Pristionchus fissidentatus]